MFQVSGGFRRLPKNVFHPLNQPPAVASGKHLSNRVFTYRTMGQRRVAKTQHGILTLGFFMVEGIFIPLAVVLTPIPCSLWHLDAS